MTRIQQLLAAVAMVTGLAFGATVHAENFPTPPAGLERLSPLGCLLTPAPVTNTYQPVYTQPAYTYDMPCTSYVYQPIYTPPVSNPVFTAPYVAPVYQPYQSSLPLAQIQYMQQSAVSQILWLARNPYASPAEVSAAYNNLTYWNNVYNMQVQRVRATQQYRY